MAFDITSLPLTYEEALDWDNTNPPRSLYLASRMARMKQSMGNFAIAPGLPHIADPSDLATALAAIAGILQALEGANILKDA